MTSLLPAVSEGRLIDILTVRGSGSHQACLKPLQIQVMHSLAALPLLRPSL